MAHAAKAQGSRDSARRNDRCDAPPASPWPGLDRTRAWRVGPDGVPVLRRHRVPYLRECDPLTGEVTRASKTTAIRYERDSPGELVHVDVKKIGKIPDGGGWKAHGPQMGSTGPKRRARIG